MKLLQVGDTVKFSTTLVYRISKAYNMVGTILKIEHNIAQVETNGTWPNEEGETIRWIPIANLRKMP